MNGSTTSRSTSAPARTNATGIRQIIGLGASLTLAAACLSACSTSADATAGAAPAPGSQDCPAGQADALVLVLPVHQGAPAPALPEQWRCTIKATIERAGTINVITAEGTPKVAIRFQAHPDRINPTAFADDVQNAEASLLAQVRQIKAASNGNDSWGALLMAADQLTSQGADGTGGLILSRDNLLSDTGLLRETDPGMTAAEPSDVAQFIRNNQACGHLADKNIRLYGVAEAAVPQPVLSARQRTTITNQYLTALTECKAKAEATPMPGSSTGPDTSFTTQTVAAEAPTRMEVRVGTTVTLAQESLAYLPDEAAFADSAKAHETLTQIAAGLKNSPQTNVIIRGRTASGPTRWPSLAALGKARADLCAQTLRSAGINPDQIHTEGAGYLATPPITSPATAALNRATDFSFTTR